MKKLIALLLALAMVLSLAACGNNEGTNPSNDTTPTTPSQPAGNSDVTPTVDAATLGGKLWAAFEAAQAANPSATAEEMANILATNENIPFMCGAMPIEPGFLAGFGEYEVTGFEQGAVYMPMIGSIPFVGYIFDLADGADVAAFIQSLEENCNPRWNICVTAEQTVVGSKGNRVFFLMCPENLETEGGDEGETDVEVIFPTVEEGTLGDRLWNSFLSFIEINSEAPAAEAAFMVTMDESVAMLGLGAMEMEPGFMYGFDNYEITDFEQCGVFMPMIGSIPFVGYVFKLAEGADVANFIADLEANWNPRWNICVTAEQTVCGAYGNYVFFLMCPATIEAE